LFIIGLHACLMPSRAIHGVIHLLFRVLFPPALQQQMLVQDSVLVESPHYQPAMGMEPIYLDAAQTTHFWPVWPSTNLQARFANNFHANLHLREELPAASHHARFVHYEYLVDIAFSALF
jgi:predicted glycoside hydrolase/deacetylase ChbG (UPF0249 family)